MTPQAMRAPLFPVGSVLKSFGAAGLRSVAVRLQERVRRPDRQFSFIDSSRRSVAAIVMLGRSPAGVPGVLQTMFLVRGIEIIAREVNGGRTCRSVDVHSLGLAQPATSSDPTPPLT